MIKEMYVPQKIIDVESLEISKDETVHSPFPDLDVVMSVGDSEEETGFEQISRFHGRSLSESENRHKEIWTDDNDIPFGSRDLKGTMKPKAGEFIIQPSAESDFNRRGYGLVDNHDIDISIKASQVFRKIGLPTEALYKVSKLKEVFYKGKKIPMWLWKTRQLFHSKFNAKTLNYLKNSDFVAIERHVQVPERIRDMSYLKDAQQLKNFLKPIFFWLNNVIDSKGELIKGKTESQTFDADSSESIQQYFAEWFPNQMGAYVGRLHKNGLTHGSAHDQNWSLVGTLYDLDAVKGTELSNKEVLKQDVNRDLKDTLVTLFIIMRQINNLGFPMNDQNAAMTFVRSYLTERFGNEEGELSEILERHSLQELQALSR